MGVPSVVRGTVGCGCTIEILCSSAATKRLAAKIPLRIVECVFEAIWYGSPVGFVSFNPCIPELPPKTLCCSAIEVIRINE
jgi:hypothetical protein